MPFTTYTNNNIIAALFNGTTFPMLGDLYMALSSTTPTQAKGTTTPYWNFTEPTTGGYTRLFLNNGTGTFAVPTVGSTTNNGATPTFPNTNSATASFGNAITYFGFFDAQAGGNLLAYGQMSTSQTINTGQQLQFAENSITISND